jgi:hypothetical protein
MAIDAEFADPEPDVLRAARDEVLEMLKQNERRPYTNADCNECFHDALELVYSVLGGEYKFKGYLEPDLQMSAAGFSECPKIPEAKEMIKRTKTYMVAEHPSDTNIAEVASIGHDYTFHTHPRGTLQPSDADIETTRNLRKELLCIGLVPQKKVICYDSATLEKSCEHPA